jgi:hypothetical protein
MSRHQQSVRRYAVARQHAMQAFEIEQWLIGQADEYVTGLGMLFHEVAHACCDGAAHAVAPAIMTQAMQWQCEQCPFYRIGVCTRHHQDGQPQVQQHASYPATHGLAADLRQLFRAAKTASLAGGEHKHYGGKGGCHQWVGFSGTEVCRRSLKSRDKCLWCR